MDDIEKVGHDLLDYLVTLDFVEVFWDENGKDYYRLTDLGFSVANMLYVLNKEDLDDGYQVC
jgi:predicted transcriptional regulator with HTH domain